MLGDLHITEIVCPTLGCVHDLYDLRCSPCVAPSPPILAHVRIPLVLSGAKPAASRPGPPKFGCACGKSAVVGPWGPVGHWTLKLAT